MEISAAMMVTGNVTRAAEASPQMIAPASELATAQFAHQMASGVAPAASATPPNAAMATELLGDAAIVPSEMLAPATVQPTTTGDRILSGMQSISSDLNRSFADLDSVLKSKESLSVSDLLKAQIAVMQVSVTYELVSKGISKSTQNVEQLVKLQ